jgi:phage tail protein X
MPLVKSKSPTAFRKNIKAEVAAGKPVIKQAVLIKFVDISVTPTRSNAAQ